MSSHLLPKGKEKILSGAIDFLTDTLKAVLVSSAHTPSDSQEFLSDISSGNRLAVSPALLSVAVTSGVLTASNTSWTTVPTGHTGTYIYLIKDTGTASTSPLICIWDTGTGLPVTTTGGNISDTWNTSGLFAI